MVLVIAEAGVNHNGSLDLAKELIDAAVESGADIVKFQSFSAADLVTRNAKKAKYQILNTKNDESQFNMLEELEISFEQQKELKKYAENRNIEFLSTGFDLSSVKFLNKLNLNRFKIPSGEITNLPYLRLIGSFKKPVILSTGMSNLNEVKEALEQLYIAGLDTEDITILHCTSQYPAPIKDVNLMAMNTLRNFFKTKIGYSDHTLGIEVALAAVALGAEVIEKHLTLDKNLDGPDHMASLEPNEFSNLVSGIRKISLSLGSHEKKVSTSEKENRKVARKSIIAKTNIKKNDFFTEDNICTKRPGTGISPMEWDNIIGLKSKKDFKKDDLIEI